MGRAKVSATYEPGWLKLLHYEKKGIGYVSLVENEAFFLHDEGRQNPEAEYQAAIDMFSRVGDSKKCDFPARFIYLKRLEKVTGDLSNCEDYQKFLNDVQPKAVTMLFTNAYMSNPSSLFGHTLFRIDTKRKGTQLLAHGANFGADTGDETGVLYALKGLWGGYYGTFGIKPYYDVINLYNNIENRDIWEYRLGFSESEMELFVAHLWEMKNAKIRYYFASKNCSYVLLLMIEAAKPELEIAEEFGVYTVPLRTLKVTSGIEGLVEEVNYRPSRQSKLKYRAAQMNKGQKEAFARIIKTGAVDLSLLNEEEKADVLETAYQYVQYRYVEGKIELADYRKKSFELLRERSKIDNKRQYFNELKEGENPVWAHEDMQGGVLFGARNGEAFQEISFKPLYNSLMEDSFGLLKGAEINMFDTKIRHYDGQDQYVLEEFKVLGIKSLVGADIMFKPFSYDLSGSVKRVFDAKSGESHAAAEVSLGGGQSYALGENVLFYVLGVPQAAYSGGLTDNGYAAIGIKGGVYYNSGKVRLNLSGMQNFATNYVARGQIYEAEAAYGLTRNVMLYAKYKMFNTKYFDDEEAGLGIRVSF